MPYFVAFMGLLAICLAVVAGLRFMGSGSPGASLSQVQAAETAAPPAMSREEVVARLRSLTKQAPPKELAQGAMCYKPAGPADRVEYVCPRCGQRTLYATSPQPDATLTHGGVTNLVAKELPAARRLVGEVTGLTVQLDEHELCRRCTPDITSPHLALLVTLHGEKTPRKVSPITTDDLRLLKAFGAGSTVYKDAYDNESPLKDHLNRLSTLLGISPEELGSRLP